MAIWKVMREDLQGHKQWSRCQGCAEGLGDLYPPAPEEAVQLALEPSNLSRTAQLLGVGSLKEMKILGLLREFVTGRISKRSLFPCCCGREQVARDSHWVRLQLLGEFSAGMAQTLHLLMFAKGEVYFITIHILFQQSKTSHDPIEIYRK